MEKISPPVRIFAVVIVLVGVAGMLALRTMGPSAEPVAIPVPVQKPVQKAAAKATAAKAKAAPAAKAPAVRKAAKAPAKTAPPVNAVKQALPPTGFPKVVDRALQQHGVVVVSLVVPGARVDALAAAEAEAGAKLGGAGFLALDVLDEGTARALLTKLNNVSDPSLLVLTRSGEVAVQLNGFVDRETVAQAAANASP